MELLYRVGGLTGDEIGSLFGIGASAVSQERKRLVSQMAEDEALKKLFEELFLKTIIPSRKATNKQVRAKKWKK
jgi:hypothetical protein